MIDAAAAAHRCVEADHSRVLASVFDDVEVRRLAYRKAGAANMHPPTPC